MNDMYLFVYCVYTHISFIHYTYYKLNEVMLNLINKVLPILAIHGIKFGIVSPIELNTFAFYWANSNLKEQQNLLIVRDQFKYVTMLLIDHDQSMVRYFLVAGRRLDLFDLLTLQTWWQGMLQFFDFPCIWRFWYPLHSNNTGKICQNGNGDSWLLLPFSCLFVCTMYGMKFPHIVFLFSN